ARQELIDRRLLRADELGEKAALGQELVHKDRADGIALLVRPEVEEMVRHSPPHRGGLIRLAGVSLDDMPEGWGGGSRDLAIRDSDPVVVHRRSPLFPRQTTELSNGEAAEAMNLRKPTCRCGQVERLVRPARARCTPGATNTRGRRSAAGTL